MGLPMNSWKPKLTTYIVRVPVQYISQESPIELQEISTYVLYFRYHRGMYQPVTIYGVMADVY